MLTIVALIQAIENDEERAKVEQIFHCHYKYMLSMSMSILNNHHDAEDAVQEAFCRICKNVQVFLNLNSDETAALLTVYTKNAAINIYNRNKKQREIFELSGDIENRQAYRSTDPETPQAFVINNETIHLIHDAINQLDDKYRDVIILKYYYHMRNAEIADALQIEPGTVNVHVLRAKKELKEILGEEGYERITY